MEGQRESWCAGKQGWVVEFCSRCMDRQLITICPWVAKWIKTANVRVSQQGDNFFESKSVDSVPEVPLHLADSSTVACSAPRTAPRRFSRILCLAPLLLKIVWACWPTLVLKEAEAPKQAQFQHELIFPLSNIQFLKLYESQFVFLEEQELSAILHKIVIRYHYLYGRQPCSLTHSTVGIQYLSCAGHCPN